MVPEPSSWQGEADRLNHVAFLSGLRFHTDAPLCVSEFATSTRFLQPESNDMGQYTTRHLKGLNVSCDGALNADGGAFDVYIYGLELLRPNGSALTLDAFDKAWPGKQIRVD